MATTATTTQAYVARRPNENGTLNIGLENVKYPGLGPLEILVDIVAASLCHTDVLAAQGEFLLKPPLILGHEASGYVRDVGDRVTYVRPGDAVVLSYASCGICKRCMKGQQPYCDRLWELNYADLSERGGPMTCGAEGSDLNAKFFGQSSMAKVALCHEACAVKVDCKREGLKLFASLGCGVQTGAGAMLNVARPSAGSTVAIWGGGAVGLAAVMAARLVGARPILIDNSATKLSMIPKALLSDARVINSADLTERGQVAAKLRSLTHDNEGPDYCLDCVGSTKILTEAQLAMTKRGMLLTIASGRPGEEAALGLGAMLIKGTTYRGTHQGDSISREMIPKLIALWKEGKFAFDEMLTEYKFEELDKALEDVRAGKVIKPILVM